jgi:hypothetical protein
MKKEEEEEDSDIDVDDKIKIGNKIRRGFVVRKPKYTYVDNLDMNEERDNYGIVIGKKWPGDIYKPHDQRMYAYGAKEYEKLLMGKKEEAKLLMSKKKEAKLQMGGRGIKRTRLNNGRIHDHV